MGILIWGGLWVCRSVDFLFKFKYFLMSALHCLLPGGTGSISYLSICSLFLSCIFSLLSSLILLLNPISQFQSPLRGLFLSSSCQVNTVVISRFFLIYLILQVRFLSPLSLDGYSWDLTSVVFHLRIQEKVGFAGLD